MNEVGGFFSSVSCTRWHLANVSNDNAHMGEPIFSPENMEDSGRVWETSWLCADGTCEPSGVQKVGLAGLSFTPPE